MRQKIDIGIDMATVKKALNSVERLSKREKADIYLYNAPVTFSAVDKLREVVCRSGPRNDNAIVFLTTYGGDADSAYRLAACLRRYYESVGAYLFGPCKSAGTLAVLGTDSIVMGDFGEMGPLDVQMTKPDEIVSTGSGLDIFQAMGVLTNSAFEAFETYFLKIIDASEGHISAKTAAEIARELAVGLFAPVTAQIEPERLGEVQRAINIANVYGNKLNRGNLKRGALEKLVQDYPSHGFVIDLEEANELFVHVRAANELEASVAALLPIRRPSKEPIIADVVQRLTAQKGHQNVARTKAVVRRRTGRNVPAAGAARATNVAQLRPEISGDVATSDRDNYAKGTSTQKAIKPSIKPPRTASV